ncbi:dihydrolipoamide acetyltransferase [Corallococcus coralloides DSM 2259]|uniref:Dihydrolipoamide acetyltransferase n=1 Tax=Corallococcus coralloides (strain ATCC 25202 / DSM 2259 / NBRC 100086 / M2) TaxID=1144275 RepID=H8MKA0_CORCM|nr:dihydrolipoamide acetyltransferase [Corallococcus coralloides DSM 2259]
MTRNQVWVGAVLFVGLLSYGVSRLGGASDVNAREPGASDTPELQRLKAQVRELEASVAHSERLAREAHVAARAQGPRLDTPMAPAPASVAMRPPDAGLATEGMAAPPPEPTPDEAVARMDARFFGEGVDTAWSHDATRRAERLGEALPQGARIVSLECRSSMCRLQMSHPSQDAFQKFLREGLIDDANAWEGPFMAALTGTPGRPGEVEAVAYLARAGVELAP